MKKKIVIASMLKPIDDVRAYWKLSQSMAKTNKYEVNIIGNEGKKEEDQPNIKFVSHSINRRDWLKRIIIRERILFKILRIKPSLVIITTHELINTALIAKLFTGCRLVYDVQENYTLNLTGISPSTPRRIAASLIRWKENFSRFFIDQYWLAEKSYEEELSFVKKRSLIIENKAFKYKNVGTHSEFPKLLFSGTVSEYGGIKLAVEVFKKIQKVDEQSILTIIGQVHDEKLESWLKSQEKECSNLNLNISQKPVPYEDILDATSQSNLGIIAYQPTRVNEQKIPTKLYEYSRYQLPYLVQKDTMWSEVGEELGGAIAIDFSTSEGDVIVKQWQNQHDLFPDQYPDEAKWESESIKVIESIKTLID